jgi:DNA repair protein RadD
MVLLRPYQEQFVGDIRHAFRSHRRVLAVAPTGAGKTVCFAYITKGALAKGNRIVIAVHRTEIVDQIGRALDQFGVRYGFIRPVHHMTDDPVQVCMIQTLARRLDRVPAPSILVIDESHHAITGQYRKVLDAWPDARVLGVTATPLRLDGKGLGAVFQAIVEAPSVSELIDGGWLSGIDYYCPPSTLDLTDVRTKFGDYNLDDLAAATAKSTITGDAIREYKRRLLGKRAVCFCVTVEDAETTAQAFRDAGIPSESIDGSLSKADRAARVSRLDGGDTLVMTSCELISEGFDIPSVAGAILRRKTKSLSVYLQQIGRCLRLKPDGSRAVILDHVGNFHTHGSPLRKREWSLEDRQKRPAEIGVRTCEVCFRSFEAGEKYDCPSVDSDPGCLFAPKEHGVRSAPETIEGDLSLMNESPEWSGGINIVRASGFEFKQMLSRARTIEQLQEIASARGYKPGWTFKIMQERRARG